MMKQTVTIELPANFTDKQQRLILKYLFEGRQRIYSTEWPLLLRSFNELHKAFVITQTEVSTFREVYNMQVDMLFADLYIEELLKLHDVMREFPNLRIRISGLIVKHLQQVDLQRPEWPLTNLLLSYCLYFWESFTAGYAFEVRIFRDLTASGMIFNAHDIRSRQERYLAYDLEVLGLYGDIKTSTYFLKVGRSQKLPHDFYITRFYDTYPAKSDKKGRQRILVVMLKPAAWNKIDGQTVTRLLEEAAEAFPSPVRVELDVGPIVVADYEVWKEKVLLYQYGKES